MITLLVIWGISGAIVTVLLVVAWKKDRAMNFTAFPSATLGNIVWEELMLGRRALLRVCVLMRPHAETLSRFSVRTISRGRGFFIRRIYGKIRIERGITPSFFLKQIAEHRDERREGKNRGV